MKFCGFSENFHDAGIALIGNTGNIEFASASERYTKIKNDRYLDYNLKQELFDRADHISFYEDWEKRLRFHDKHRITIGEKWENMVKLRHFYKQYAFIDHHMSHAATAFYTRPWESTEDTVMLVIDGHGEDQSATIYDNKFNEIYKIMYPASVGTIYGQVTNSLGFKTLQEEYNVMGLAAYGEPLYEDLLLRFYRYSVDEKARVRECSNIQREIIRALSISAKPADLAASVQSFAEKEIIRLCEVARIHGNKLVYSGGVAQNIVANSKIKQLFDDVWITPAPTDSGSSLGVAAYYYAQQTGKNRIIWKDAYLGYNLESKVNPRKVVNYILQHKICGVANGKAEFGPRSLGNRSLLADVRYPVKDTVNKIKKREQYRPFAPAILEEYADKYFEGPMNQYMQYTCRSLHDYNSVTHVDGTARVQLVPSNSSSILRQILEEYYERTGVPMLLNTSLNVKGKPIANDYYDIDEFEAITQTKVFS